MGMTSNQLALVQQTFQLLLDPAVKRRFAVHHEVFSPTKEECIEMMNLYLSNIPLSYCKDEVNVAANRIYKEQSDITQAYIFNFMVERIADAVIHKKECVVLV